MTSRSRLGPAISPEAVAWAFRELGRRAGAPCEVRGAEIRLAGVRVGYGDRSADASREPVLLVAASDATAWGDLLARAPGTIETVSPAQVLPPGAAPHGLGASLPVLFSGKAPQERRRFVRRLEDGSICFGADLVSATLFLLTRWEETVSEEHDLHGRMPHTASVAHRQGFLDRPLIDEYALILRAWLRVLHPEWRPAAPTFEIRLSHDVDVVRPVETFGGGIRQVGAALVRHRDFSRAREIAADLVGQTFAPRRNRHYRGLFRLAGISRRHGLPSAFYFMSAARSDRDSGYDVSRPWIRDAAERLRSDGWELGFHAGYQTFENSARLAEEKARLDDALDVGRCGGRQHYLRFRAPDTWRHWEQAGLAYDSTLTFAGHEGFRCGTCHPYRPFDIEANREMDLEEIPLIVMDGTLRHYRDLEPPQATRRVLELADRCRNVGGIFTLLWHNSSFDGEWEPWGREYERMVAGLARLRDESRASPSSVLDEPIGQVTANA